MDSAYEFVSNLLGIPLASAVSLVASFIWFIAILATRFLLLRLIYYSTDSASGRYMARKITFYLAIATLLVALLSIWLEDISSLSLATYFGLISAGVAIALRDMFANLAGWLYIIIRRPFEVGDRVEIDGITGDVVDLAAFEFVLVEIGNWVPADQSTGRLIFVPNGLLFTRPLFNFTRGFNFIWEDLSITVTFDSDWATAKQVMTDIVQKEVGEFVTAAEEEVKKATSQFYIMFRNLSPIVYTAVVQNGIQLSVRYVVPPRQRRKTSQLIWERILTEFGKTSNITFAYTAYRAYLHTAEGTHAAPPSPNASQLTSSEPPPPKQ